METRITPLRVAAAALFVLAGVGLASLLSPLVGSALATVGNTVNISDHSTSAYFAKVDSSGALKTTAAVTGRVAPAAPASPWSKSEYINGTPAPGVAVAGPTSGPINLTSVSLSTDVSSGNGVLTALYTGYVSSSAGTCTGPSNWTLIWMIRDLGDGTTPLSFDFPTPLQSKPSPGFKTCLYALTSASSATTINAVGFYS